MLKPVGEGLNEEQYEALLEAMRQLADGIREVTDKTKVETDLEPFRLSS